MPGSDAAWHPWRIALFLLLGAVIYAGLFLWSDRELRRGVPESPFLRLTTAPAEVDWLILGASHAIPLDVADIPQVIADRTGQRIEVLGAPGMGPFVLRLLAERWFVDHRSRGVVIVLDDFAFGDRRWNEDRLSDIDFLPKMPADLGTARILGRAVPRGLPWQTWVAQVTGFARINDPNRHAPPRWTVGARFDSAPRPSAAAIRSRVAFLYPPGADAGAVPDRIADLEAMIRLARGQGARVVLLRPPLPDAFRAALPEMPGLAPALDALSRRFGVPIVDHGAAIPDPRHYFDTDHLDRRGVLLWLDLGLARVLAGNDGGQ